MRTGLVGLVHRRRGRPPVPGGDRDAVSVVRFADATLTTGSIASSRAEPVSSVVHRAETCGRRAGRASTDVNTESAAPAASTAKAMTNVDVASESATTNDTIVTPAAPPMVAIMAATPLATPTSAASARSLIVVVTV